MTHEVAKLLEKAAKAIDAAEALIEKNFADAAAGRAYYAMFYTAEALLASKGLGFKKHGGVHAAFGEQFAKTGLLDSKFHRWILNAFDRRIDADYGIDRPVPATTAQAMVGQAREFLLVASRFLKNDPV